MTRLLRPTLIALLLAGTAPAIAQQQTVEGRVNRLEREMRAVQRKVFPDGSQQFVEPEITPAAPAGPPPGVPAGAALNDLTSRVDALERQVQQITNQAEQNQFRLRQLEEQMTRFRQDAELRLNTLEGNGPGVAPSGAVPPPRGAAPAPAVEPPVFQPPPPRGSTSTGPLGRPTPPRTGPEVTAPEPAIAAPASTGDPAEDAYLAGYRLWEQKRFADAQAALKAAATKYPKHRRYSYAQNLLGRAYLDDGKPALAAEAFYANYRAMPRGERAPDSLLYLGQSLVRLKKTAEACRVYDELQDVYGTTFAPAMKTRVAAARADAKCAA